MEKIKVIHDTVGHTLTVWIGDPLTEHIDEETGDEVVLMKDATGHVIGFEMLNYHPAQAGSGISVEAVVQPAA